MNFNYKTGIKHSFGNHNHNHQGYSFPEPKEKLALLKRSKFNWEQPQLPSRVPSIHSTTADFIVNYNLVLCFVSLFRSVPGDYFQIQVMITLTKRLKKEAENRGNNTTTSTHEHHAPKRISIRDKLLVKEVYHQLIEVDMMN